MRILVTGAAGFIGSALCEQLMLSSNEVTAVDNFSDYYDVSLKRLRVKELLSPLSLEVLDLDICDQSKVEKIIASSNPEVVIHLAAQAGVRLGVSESRKYVESNLVGFSNVLISTIENKIPKFLYASSSSVYGDKAEIPYSESESNLHPSSFYGSTKLANELLVPTLVKNSETVARGLRFFTVYGPYGRPDMSILRFIHWIINREEVQVFGNGEQRRSFTYVDDVISALVKVMNHNSSGTFNIGSNNTVSLNRVIEIIEDSTDVKSIVVNKERAIKDPDVVKPDLSHIKQTLDWEPTTLIDKGVQKTVEWYLENIELLKSLNYINK